RIHLQFSESHAARDLGVMRETDLNLGRKRFTQAIESWAIGRYSVRLERIRFPLRAISGVVHAECIAISLRAVADGAAGLSFDIVLRVRRPREVKGSQSEMVDTTGDFWGAPSLLGVIDATVAKTKPRAKVVYLTVDVVEDLHVVGR